MRRPQLLTRIEGGWTYLAVMVAVSLMGIASAAAGKNWAVIVQRDREAELLFRGLQIKDAIERYAADYEVRKGTRENVYPVRLEQLVEGPKRYLPRVFLDPITGEEFESIFEKGEIHGVRSRSHGRPFNRVQFQDAATYQDIEFKAFPPSSMGQQCPGGGMPGINPLNPLTAPTCPSLPTKSVDLVAELPPPADEGPAR